MTDRLCLDKSLVVSLIIIFSILAIYAHAAKTRADEQKHCPPCPQCPTEKIKIRNERISQPVGPPMLDADPVKDYDYRKITDILMAPERRMPRHTLPPDYLMGLYTRGFPDNYTSIGFLTREISNGKPDETRLPLFGRQTYPGSSLWEYYTSTTNLGVNIKIPFETQRRYQELQSGDIVKLKAFENAEYKVHLYKLDEPRYNPYVISPSPVFPGY